MSMILWEFDFEFFALEEDYTTELVISTANVLVSTTSAEVSIASLEVKTATESLVYIRRSATKRKDKRQSYYERSWTVQKKQAKDSRVHEEASTFNAEEWDNIQAQIEADEELAHREYGKSGFTTLKKLSFDESQGGKFKETKIGEGSKPAEDSKDECLKTNYNSNGSFKLWSLVHERFNSTEPTEDKERELWVELKRLFEPDDDDTLWKLQRYMHDPLKWKLYDTCAIHHMSIKRGHDIFMLVEKDYPLTRALITLMLSNKLKSCLEASSQHRWFNSKKLVDLNDNHKFKGGLLGIKGFYNFVLLVQLSTSMRKLSTAMRRLNTVKLS
ncbi:hypothetical protein Tco_0762195 [Tanacetum coccineum]